MKLYSVFNFLILSLTVAACVTGQIAAPTIPPTTTAIFELPMLPAASAYLTEALDIMQNNSLHRYSIDWEVLRTTAFKMAEHAQTPADTYGVIRYALYQLGDHHSFFLTAKE